MHLAVCADHPCARHERFDPVLKSAEVLDPVVDKVYLPAPFDFIFERRPYQFIVIFCDLGLDREAVARLGDLGA